MYDNGLLKYYFEQKANGTAQKGCIDLSGLNLKYTRIPAGNDMGSNRNIFKIKGRKMSFYQKKVYCREEMDREILLSQIFARAGFKTAISTPTTPVYINRKDEKHVTSNNIASGAVEAFRFYSSIQEIYDAKSPSNIVLFPEKKLGRPFDISNYFTKDCVREILKMQLFDTALFNMDRHSGNYFLEISDDGKAEGIRVFDHGDTILPFEYGFRNHFGDGENKSDREMIESFRENETVRDFMTVPEMVEALDQIDVVDTAKDIESTIDYSVDNKLVDTLSWRIDCLKTDLEA